MKVNTMKALHFGAGQYRSWLYRPNCWLTRGYNGVCGCKPGRTRCLNARHSYQVHVVGGENEQVDTVSGVNAVSGIGDDVVDLIAHVGCHYCRGAGYCGRIAPAIAKGLVKRRRRAWMPAEYHRTVIWCAAPHSSRSCDGALADGDKTGLNSTSVLWIPPLTVLCRHLLPPPMTRLK